MIARQEGPAFEVGLSSDVEYAAAQHEGFTGTVIVPAHTRRYGRHRIAYADVNTGKMRSRTVRRWGMVRSYSMRMNLKPKKFFTIPIRSETSVIMDELFESLGWAE